MPAHHCGAALPEVVRACDPLDTLHTCESGSAEGGTKVARKTQNRIEIPAALARAEPNADRHTSVNRAGLSCQNDPPKNVRIAAESAFLE